MNKRLILWIQYIGFITIGLVSGITGPMLVAIGIDIPMNFGQSGLILSGQSLGMLFSVLIGGYISDKFGKKPFLITGGILLLIGLFGSMLSMNFIVLLSFTIIIGFGFGIYEVGINALCADFSESNHGRNMNFLHLFFGLGAILAPVIATLCIKLFNNWRITFALAMILPLLVTILIATQKLPHTPISNLKENLPYKSIFIWMAGVTVLIYVGIEISVYGWLPLFWKNMFPKAFIPASLTATIFWICLTIGRLLSGKIVDKIGFPKHLIFSSILIVLLGFLWVIFPFKFSTLIIVGLIGIALSGIFPTIMASATSNFPKIPGIIVSFIIVFASLGGLFIPSKIGTLADSFGINILPLCIMLMGGVMSLMAFLTWKIIYKKNK